MICFGKNQNIGNIGLLSIVWQKLCGTFFHVCKGIHSWCCWCYLIKIGCVISLPATSIGLGGRMWSSNDADDNTKNSTHCRQKSRDKTDVCIRRVQSLGIGPQSVLFCQIILKIKHFACNCKLWLNQFDVFAITYSCLDGVALLSWTKQIEAQFNEQSVQTKHITPHYFRQELFTL